jgi:hypothetical protein
MRMLSAVEIAARNNASWCDTFCRTHDIVGAFGADRWASAVRTPPRYPDAITLTRTAPADELLRCIDTSSGCSVKDSFATLDLAPAGFRVLFDAQWMQHDAPLPTVGGRDLWSAVTTPADLEIWEGEWSDESPSGTFAPALLEIDSVTVFGERDRSGFRSGAIANHDHGVVGVTNFFTDGDHEPAWARCVATVADAFPNVPIVGYESGAELEAACRRGFSVLGPLRVWLAP